ncbi:MAG TPA: LysM peptidoglycan-binding domain-containing protein [Clostridiaceae bacterium]|nr:LysM peptidoglycan-binding domain-containing protein [Clostridiaceae bacterium]
MAARSLLDEDKLDEAVVALEALGDYKDSAELAETARAKLQEVLYQAAVQLLDADRPEDADPLLRSLGDYADSQALLADAELEIDYRNARDLLAAGEYKLASVAFRALGDYKDSAALFINAESLAAAEHPEPLTEAIEYTAQAGDSWYLIGQTFYDDTSYALLKEIAAANDSQVTDPIEAGQTLTLPPR